jgi:beta-carotene 15,15'-dioxygenase
MVLSFGILHGANDMKLIQKTSEKFNFSKTLLIYVVTILITLVAFLIWPTVFLIIFILVSSYHFGEQHLSHKVNNLSRLTPILNTSYGLVIFLLIFYMHADLVIIILNKITNIEFSAYVFKSVLIFVTISTLLLLIILKIKKILDINLIEEFLILILFLVIFSNATLLWSFTIYFIVWHSLPSLKDQLILIYGTITKKSMYCYLKSSFIYWFMSLLGISFLIYQFSENSNNFYTFSTALIFSITFPHIIIISKINK